MPFDRAHVRELLAHRADRVFLGVIALFALLVLSMPLSKSVRHHFMYAMHGRKLNPVVMAGVQAAPKMYNFANHYWFSPTPLTVAQLSGDPAKIERVEFGWMNHYPIWMMTHYWRVVLKDHGVEQGYFYMGSRWRGEAVFTGYHLRQDVFPNGDERATITRVDP